MNDEQKGMTVQGSGTTHGVVAQNDGPKKEGELGGKVSQSSRTPLAKGEPAPPDPEVVEKPMR